MISEKDILLLKQVQKEDPEIYSLIERIQQNPSAIMSKVSHKIKNIISITSSSLQFIESQHPETSDFNLWPQLKSSVAYLAQFMDQEALYRHSAIIELKPMNLQDLLWTIPDLMDDLYESNTNNSIRNFNYDIASNIPEINGDYSKLKFAFIEIMKNAFEATSDNDIITIIADIIDNSVAITIRDEGVGIDSTIIHNVTEPFFTTKTDHVGTGLSTANRIVKAHGGNLNIASDENTCVTITLPL